MSTRFRPGNIIVDERSEWGDVHSVSNPPRAWPDGHLWSTQVNSWLTGIASANKRVGRLLLDRLQANRPDNMAVRIVRHRESGGTAFTDGPVRPNSAGNPHATSCVFITFTPAGAWRQPENMNPDRHPGSVLVHELVHAYMGTLRLNGLRLANNQRNPISTWQSAAYPNHNEFCAVTVQNMFLSEHGAVLADGYNVDDPTIESTPAQPARDTGFGLGGSSSVDLDEFVRRYRRPLQFMKNQMPGLVNGLASLRHVSFNPFARMQ